LADRTSASSPAVFPGNINRSIDVSIPHREQDQWPRAHGKDFVSRPDLDRTKIENGTVRKNIADHNRGAAIETH
jgi:hypothetical protein